MKNAHLRFGHLVYTRVNKKSSTQIRLTLDRVVAEPLEDHSWRAHLISVIGTDTAIAAVHAAVIGGDRFTVEDPGGVRVSASLGARAECFRGSLPLARGGRPLRHLVGLSEELVQAGKGGDKERSILLDDGNDFVWTSLAARHGLPGLPEWANWVVDELRRQRRVTPLTGIGGAPILVSAGRSVLLSCLSRGLRRGILRFPETNGPIEWPAFPLATLLEAEA